AIAVLLAAAVYPMGLPAWAARTGDTFPNASRWLQAAIVLISVGIVANTVDSHLQWNLVLTLGALALAAAAYAASGRFKPVITVVLVCATGMLLYLGAYLAQTTGSFPEEAQSTVAAT